MVMAPHNLRSRTFILASALKPEAAARAVGESPQPIDLVVVSPTALAREAAGFAVGGRWVDTVEEHLLAPRAPHESGNDVVARLACVLRSLGAFKAEAPLVVCDGLDILGSGVFALDEEGAVRLADDLERLLPLP